MGEGRLQGESHLGGSWRMLREGDNRVQGRFRGEGGERPDSERLFRLSRVLCGLPQRLRMD